MFLRRVRVPIVCDVLCTSVRVESSALGSAGAPSAIPGSGAACPRLASLPTQAHDMCACVCKWICV